MDWEHKGIMFKISTQQLGSLVLASAQAPAEGMYIRVRPFSALGTDRDEALEILKNQIREEYRKVPEMTV